MSAAHQPVRMDRGAQRVSRAYTRGAHSRLVFEDGHGSGRPQSPTLSRRSQAVSSKPVVWLTLGLAVGSVAFACSGSKLTHRFVDEPAGAAHELGAPQNTVYMADVATERDLLHVRVYEQSECERIRVSVVSRTQETLRGDRVVERQLIGPVQIADGSDGMVPCNQRYARDAEVALQTRSATYRLGRTDPFGELQINLSEELKSSLYGEQLPGTLTLLVERQPVAQVSLAELAKHEARVAELAEELRAILDRPEQSHEDVSRSYVLYRQLHELSRHNPEVRALADRFIERVYDRKAEEGTEQLKRNLEALNTAKDLLSANPAVVPMYVRVAIQSGETSLDALQWARGQLALGVHEHPTACQQLPRWEPFAQSQWSLPTRLALHYLRYAYDDGLTAAARALCSNMPR